MSGHTFSNWKVAAQTPSRVDTPDGSISVSWSSNADGGERDRKAEEAARLIAAAPDMLEACQAARALTPDGTHTAKVLDHAIKAATGAAE